MDTCQQLSLNIDKTHVIPFSNTLKVLPDHVKINNTELKQVDCTKFLGLYSASLKKGNPSLTQNISKVIKDVTTLISVGDSIVILLSFDILFNHL